VLIEDIGTVLSPHHILLTSLLHMADLLWCALFSANDCILFHYINEHGRKEKGKKMIQHKSLAYAEKKYHRKISGK